MRTWRRSDGEELSPSQFENDDGSPFGVFGEYRVAVSSDEKTWVVDTATADRRCSVEASQVTGAVVLSLGDGEHFSVVDDPRLWVIDSGCDIVEELSVPHVYGAWLPPDGSALRLLRGDGGSDERTERYWIEELAVGSWTLTKLSGSDRDEPDLFVDLPPWIVLDGGAEAPRASAFLELAEGDRIALGDGFDRLEPTIEWLLAPNGRTAVVVVQDPEGGPAEGFVVSLPDRTLRRRIEVPSHAFHQAIDASSQWLTVVEEDTILLYDLR